MTGSYRGGRFYGFPGLLDALGMEKEENPIISVVGAGGKTTAALRLKEEFLRGGKRAAVTTTTHMLLPETPAFLPEPSIERAKEILEREGWVFAGEPAGNGKIKAFPDPFLKELCNLKIPVIIEADGARRLPLKMPGEREPAIYPDTDVVIGVIGLDAVGKRLKEACFRPELAAEFLKKELEELITCEDAAKIALSRKGLRKCAGQRKYWVFLHKADTDERKEAGRAIAEMLEKEGFFQTCLTAGPGERHV